LAVLNVNSKILSCDCKQRKRVMAASQKEILNIRKFDLGVIEPDAKVIVVGQPGSGKTTLIKHLLWAMRDKLDTVVGMNETEESTRTMAFFCPPCFVFHNYSSAHLRTILDYQRMSVLLSRQRGNKHTYRHIGFISDDCMSDKSVLKTKEVRELCMMSRHRKMFFVLGVQYLMDMPTDIRGQIDYVFAFKNTRVSERRKLYEHFFGVFEKVSDFEAALDTCTQGYDCMVLNNRIKSTNLNDCISWFCAKPITSPFKVGRSIFYNLSAHYFRDQYVHDIVRTTRARNDSRSREGKNVVARKATPSVLSVPKDRVRTRVMPPPHAASKRQ